MDYPLLDFQIRVYLMLVSFQRLRNGWEEPTAAICVQGAFEIFLNMQPDVFNLKIDGGCLT